MDNRRSIALLLAAASVAAALVSTGSAAARPKKSVVVDGTTTFTASETSVTSIRFAQPIANDDYHFHIKGNGRLYGFVMRKVGYYGDRTGPKQEGARPTIKSVTTGECTKPGCVRKHEPFHFISLYNVKELRGEWDVYVIADGSPVRIQLKVKGSKNNNVVRVDGPVRSEMRTMTPRVHETNTDSVYSAGDFARLKDPDFGAIALWAIGRPHVVTAHGVCHYAKREDVPDDVRLLPGCPTGYSNPWVHPYPGEMGGFISTSMGDGDTRGLAGWFTAAAGVQRYGAVGLWIDYPEVSYEKLYES